MVAVIIRFGVTNSERLVQGVTKYCRAALLARKARREGLIRDDISLNTVILYINKFRNSCQNMLDYDWVNVPIVYTQVGKIQ